jgi:hypothetical protein
VQNYTFTVYQNKHDTTGQQKTKSWKDWIPLFSAHKQIGHPGDLNASHKVHNRMKDHAAIILGPVNPGRNDKDIEEIHAMSIDLDQSTNEQASKILLEILSPYEHIWYTTHKHGALVARGMPRIRVVLPLQSPHTPDQHLDYWGRLNALVLHSNDIHTKNPARLNYLPSTFDLALAESHHNPGILLDPSALPSNELPESTKDPYFDDILAIKGDLIRKIKKRMEKEDPRRDALLSLLTGKDYAPDAPGHNILISCINYIAPFRKMTESQFKAIFGPSIDAHAAKSKTPDTLEMVWRDYSQLHEKKRIEAESKISVYSSGPPYTPEDYSRIMKAQNIENKEQLRTRWILQYGISSWFLNSQGEYQGPYTREDRTLAMRQHLSRAINLLTPATPSKPPQTQSYETISFKHATLLERVRADLSIQQSRLLFETPGAVLHYAINPIRTDLTPKYDPEIDDWINRMAGPLYSKTIDWLSAYMDLSKPLCAIYIAGPQGCGKSLFAHGISKLWTQGNPTKLTKVLGQFNAGIKDCPILFGDESIKMPGRQVTAEIREILGNPSRSLELKYQNPIDLIGYIRVLLAANNDGMLRDNEMKTRDDLEAIALRFLFIQPSPEATTFLRSLPPAKKEYWGNEGIARHALWLHENHTIETPGDRFVVEGDLSSMTTGLVLSEDSPNFVCESLVRHLQTPEKVEVLAPYQILRKNGSLYATARGVKVAWESHLGKTHLLPETKPISDSLKTISFCKKQVRPPGSRPIWYYEIDPEYLIRWTEEHGEIDGGELMKLIRQDTAEQNSNVIHIQTKGKK